MSSLDGIGAQAMAADGPWGADQFKRFVDIGGSRGHFLHTLLTAYDNKQGVLFDRPPVVANAKKAWAPEGGGRYHRQASRVTFVEGSFFDGASLPKARDGDAYYMRYILHDWSTAKVLEILKNVRSSMGDAEATLLIGECALPDHDTVGVPAVMYNIDMQMMAAFGEAQERTPSQWKQILLVAGFEIVKIHPTRSLLQWVETVPIRSK